MSAARALQGRRILVVEDDFLVAQVVVDILEEAGAEVVGPVGWIDEALAIVADPAQSFDGAILDVNLHGVKSYPIADALVGRAVRFIFATGYSAAVLDEAYRGHQRCEKPFNPIALIKALGETKPE